VKRKVNLYTEICPLHKNFARNDNCAFEYMTSIGKEKFLSELCFR